MAPGEPVFRLAVLHEVTAVRVHIRAQARQSRTERVEKVRLYIIKLDLCVTVPPSTRWFCHTSLVSSDHIATPSFYQGQC